MPGFILFHGCKIPTELHPVAWQHLVLFTQGYYDSTPAAFVARFTIADSSLGVVAQCLTGIAW